MVVIGDFFYSIGFAGGEAIASKEGLRYEGGEQSIHTSQHVILCGWRVELTYSLVTLLLSETQAEKRLGFTRLKTVGCRSAADNTLKCVSLH